MKKEMKILLAAGAALMTSCGVAAEKLGDGFAPLEWIESTGGQYIDTGVDAGAHTTIDMSFGHCVYGNGSTLFGKDVWDPQGFLFILQQGKFRFFGAKGKEPGEAWNLIAKDQTEERDYRFTLGSDNTARLFGADGRELCALAGERQHFAPGRHGGQTAPARAVCDGRGRHAQGAGRHGQRRTQDDADGLRKAVAAPSHR